MALRPVLRPRRAPSTTAITKEPVMELTVEDYVAIQQLYLKYSVAVDMYELDAYAECWAADGEYVGFREGGQPYAKGRAAIRAFAANNYTPTDNGFHWNTGPLL